MKESFALSYVIRRLRPELRFATVLAGLVFVFAGVTLDNTPDFFLLKSKVSLY